MTDPLLYGCQGRVDTTPRQPRVIDFDDGEISVRLDGRELRGWMYTTDEERRQKTLQAREYVEGWCDASELLLHHQLGDTPK